MIKGDQPVNFFILILHFGGAEMKLIVELFNFGVELLDRALELVLVFETL